MAGSISWQGMPDKKAEVFGRDLPLSPVLLHHPHQQLVLIGGHNSSRLSPSNISTRAEAVLTWDCYRPHSYLHVLVFKTYDKPDTAYLNPGTACSYPEKYLSMRSRVGLTRDSRKLLLLLDKIVCLILLQKEKSAVG